MALMFADGFDNYQTIVDFWDTAGSDCAIRLNTGAARTGIGCLQVNSSANGPTKAFGHKTNLLCCVAWSVLGQSAGAECMRFLQTDNFGPNIRVSVGLDGSISFFNGNGNSLQAQTAANLVSFGTYNSIAVQVNGFTNGSGIITCWVNGVQVLNAGGLVTAYDPSLPYCNAIQLMGAGGTPTSCFIDDFYLLDCSSSPNNTFLGALKLYALAPTANTSVLWTPLAGTNWSEVNEVPPDGDTSYNFSPNIGDLDQYLYPLTGVPANSSILFVEHELDMKVDSGSRSVASVVAGQGQGAPVALTAGYHIYPTPYDGPWTPASFPVSAGPKVTA